MIPIKLRNKIRRFTSKHSSNLIVKYWEYIKKSKEPVSYRLNSWMFILGLALLVLLLATISIWPVIGFCVLIVFLAVTILELPIQTYIELKRHLISKKPFKLIMKATLVIAIILLIADIWLLFASITF